MRAPRYFLSLGALLAILLISPVAPSPTAGRGAEVAPMKAGDGTAREEHARDAYGSLPLAFEANEGQGDPAARFLAHGRGYTLALAPDALTLGLPTPLRFAFPGANPDPMMRAEQPLPGVVNSFIGNDPARWRTNIPTAARVRYRDLYPGLDLVVYGAAGGGWEYDVVVAPGADPTAFALSVDGATGETLDAATGDLVLTTGGGEVRQRAPLLYQEVGGERQTVAGRYAMHDDGSVGFAVGEYDSSLPLIIDPTLVYSTYLGGSGSGSNGLDQGFGIAVDTSGNAYVTGVTTSADFPGTPPMTYHGSSDAFVTKFNASGTRVYSTYLGGGADDRGNAIAVDTGGNAYITGETDSADFSGVSGAVKGSGYDAFVVKLSTAGLVTYGVYLGGSADDQGFGIAVDTSGNAYVTGDTGSADFPVTDGSMNSSSHPKAFVAKLSATGLRVYGTYLGGSIADGGSAIAVDTSGNAYITGNTFGGFPVTDGSTFGGGVDAFVTKINGSAARIYSTYLGGSSADQGYGIAVDASGNAYITGSTNSTDFPVTPGGAPYGGGFAIDAFVTKLNASGTRAYSTYLGGGSYDRGNGIAVDAGGNAYITGKTASADFPVVPPGGSSFGGGANDAFVTKLDTSGARVYSTYLGGSGDDEGDAIAVDTGGYVYITGKTAGGNFPVTGGATFGGGGYDAFVTKIAVISSPPPVPNPLPQIQPHPAPSGQPVALPQARPTVPVVAAPNPLPARRP